MRLFKNILSLLLVLVIMLSIIGTAFATEDATVLAALGELETDNHSENSKAEDEALNETKNELLPHEIPYQYTDDEIVRAIIVLEGECEAEAGSVGSVKAAEQRVKLTNQHNTVRRAMSGIQYDLKFEFTRLLNGFSCDVSYGDLDAIAAIEGVASVHIANSYSIPELQSSADTKQPIANEITDNLLMHGEKWLGQGTVIAVLDTGLALDHEAFQDAAGWAKKHGVLTQDVVESADLWSEGIWVSSKIPYAYDYADNDSDVTDYYGHGTHVSGIAAGMACTITGQSDSVDVTFTGAAPAAQILSMKIFSDFSSATSSDIYLFALEDAYTLGADVINMSLGAPNGFTYDTELETDIFGNIYQHLSDAGIILSIAAGNDFSAADGASSYGGKEGIIGPDYTDYGTVNSPATYEGVISVASMENAEYLESLISIDGKTAPFYDTCYDGVHGWMDCFGGKELEYVKVTDSEGNISIGTKADYARTNVAGKVAVVIENFERISHEDQVKFAAKAGAIGCIVISCDYGTYMYVETYEIPAVILENSALEFFSSTGTITVPSGMTHLENPEGMLMSTFSSWGTSPNLTLDPSITSIGGMVYSSIPGCTDSYGINSGTSMATPNISGTFANLLSAIYKYHSDNGIELSKSEVADLAKALLYGSAYLCTDAEGFPYSPRKQGAGLATSYKAIQNYTESAYILNPLQELGDDPEKSGIYKMTLTVKNSSESTLYYTDFETYVMSDRLCTFSADKLANTMSPNFLYFGNDKTSAELDGNCTVTYSIGGKEISEFYLDADEEITIEVSIALSENQKAYLNEVFINGAFVEGYVFFHQFRNGEPCADTHATFLAYYGNWTDGSVLETADWRDMLKVAQKLNTVADDEGNTYFDLGYTIFNCGLMDVYSYPNEAYLSDIDGTGFIKYAGDCDNPYAYMDFYDEHISFSTLLSNGTDGHADAIYMEPSLLRNAKLLTMTVSDKETGEVYRIEELRYIPKYLPYGYSPRFFWDGTDLKGNYVPSGTVATISFDAVLPYRDTLQEDIWGFDVTVDYTAPIINAVHPDREAGTLTITASDENYLESIVIYDDNYTLLDCAYFSSDKIGESFTVTFNIGEALLHAPYIKAYITDYATNKTEFIIYDSFVTGQDATITLVMPEGTQTFAKKTGECFTLPAAPNYKDAEFQFWVDQPLAFDWEESDDLYGYYNKFEGGNTYTVTGDATFFALYGITEFVPCDEPVYSYEDPRYDCSGEWAICGWDIDRDLWKELELDYLPYDVVLNHAALTGDGKTVYVDKLDNVQFDYWDFYTTSKEIVFRFTNVSDDKYTIYNNATKKYLALVNNEIAMVDTVSDAATWTITSSKVKWTSIPLVYNVAEPDMLLVYDDTSHKFTVMDDSQPIDGTEYYPSEYYLLPLYSLYDGFDNIYRFTTELCYFDGFCDCKAEWYHEAVDYLVAKGLMNGTDVDRFDPNATLSRGMAVTVLHRMANCPPASTSSCFSDVKDGLWYSEAVAWAQSNGVVNGVTPTSFAPEQAVTREQIATILWRYAGEPKVQTDLSGFADAGEISDYARDAIAWAVAEGIMQGDGQKLNPLDGATRAEFACLITRYLDGSFQCDNSWFFPWISG